MVVTFVVGPIDYTCRVLDKQRLNKQKVEAKEILDASLIDSNIQQNIRRGWINHPAVKMWKGYSNGLRYYFNKITEECINRGMKNNMQLYEFTENQLNNIHQETIEEYLAQKEYIITERQEQINFDKIILPWWFNWEPLWLSHRASLCRKLPAYYEPIFMENILSDELTTQTQINKLINYLDKGYIWPEKLASTQILNFQPEYCDPIGTGAPAIYRWTLEQVLQWIDEPLINPKTGKKIKESKKGIYADIKKAAELYGIDTSIY